MSIKDFSEKINSNPRFRAFLLIGIICLSSTVSFSLGILFGRKTGTEPVIIRTGSQETAQKSSSIDQKGGDGGIVGNTEPQKNETNQSATVSKSLEEKPSSGAFFASKNGTKYYPTGCKAGNRIAEKNKIFFETAQQAELLGLTKASGCK